jgi:hypothetical protein
MDMEGFEWKMLEAMPVQFSRNSPRLLWNRILHVRALISGEYVIPAGYRRGVATPMQKSF